MHRARFLATTAATTLAAATVVGLAAPSATASVKPTWVRPGQKVWISDDGKCQSKDPNATWGTAFSGAFGSAKLKNRNGKLVGSATINSNASGGYKVTVKCDGSGSNWYKIGWLHVGPTGGTTGGVGGSIGGTDTAQLAGGAALVTLAAGGGAVALRRRSRSTA